MHITIATALCIARNQDLKDGVFGFIALPSSDTNVNVCIKSPERWDTSVEDKHARFGCELGKILVELNTLFLS